ncbi:hypothetical protein GCM10009098_20440 [Rheinheimera aquimaris]|uniref:Uncharacterized protein n=1 Tax=Rheinheimera aquimaris TaxID=412437 RepID=A0ABP3NX50_9GAMM|nr:hypothetical protein [Rheinheimera aquimaris]MCB5214053.1 hypothetical protein [Rheinheimera aquimaris]
MKLTLPAVFLLLSTTSIGSNLDFEVHSNKLGTVHLLTVSGSGTVGSDLVEPWYEKAHSLCPKGINRIEPQGQPLVRDKACGDAVEDIGGKQQCEVIRASVFGKIICNAP